MIQLTKQKRVTSAPRRMLGVLVLCGLNLVIAPCATAFELVDESRHHIAPEASEMAHAGHHTTQETDCCDTLQGDCCDLDDSVSKSRTDKFENQHNIALLPADPHWPALNVERLLRRDIRPPDPGNHSPPIHKIFCVYLD
jgi:hypothetical protein